MKALGLALIAASGVLVSAFFIWLVRRVSWRILGRASPAALVPPHVWAPWSSRRRQGDGQERAAGVGRPGACRRPL